jgi:2'-5' RNA ligase
MRIFFAVALPDQVRARLAEIARDLDEVSGGASVGWTAEENHHITLRFVGDAGDRELALAKEAGRVVASAGARFTITLEGAGSFGGRSPRVIWIGVKDDAGKALLMTTAQSLERELIARKFEKADHPFAAHATLGRIRPPRKGRQRPSGRASADRAASLDRLVSAVEARKTIEVGAVEVDRFVLFQSTLRGGQSPVYEPVETFALGAESQVKR